MENELKYHVTRAAGRADVCAAVLELYADVQREIDARRPICVTSGRCCRFDEYGHRLYVTTLELATFFHQWNLKRQGSPSPTQTAAAPASVAHQLKLTVLQSSRASETLGESCPFQINKLCSVHALRPFGCRMFFCDATSTEWQNEQYELFHARLKELHQTMKVPYFYVEWRVALRQIEQ